MDDSDQDYLTEYRVFFDDLYKSVELDNPLPVHIGKYNIAEFEIIGEIISWCLEYLNSRKCPSSLIAPLCRSVQLEMVEAIRRGPESCGYRAEEDDYQTLKLMQATIKKLVKVCERYRDNSKLCRLPPPPPVTPSVSSSAAKNTRRTMEDRHIVINDLHALFGIEGYGVASYYAVFDGHNGSDAAIYACSHIHQYLVESQYYPEKPEAAFKEAFLRADDRFIDKSNKENLKSGTTAVCILIRHDRGKVYVAWLGDSQAILVNGRSYIQLVNPHRPDQPEERERIEAMGGSVVFWGTWRVNGQLAVSRSIGDVDYKPYVTGEPDVSSYDLTGDEDFLLLACDGLWDVVSEQMAVEKVFDYLKEVKGDRSGVSKSLVSAAKALGSKDNISVVVAWLDMSTLENGHFGQDAEDVTDDLLLPPVLRNLKPSPQITTGEDSGDVAGDADSGEDSEEEWNYISGKENRQPNQQHKEELSREDMESQLNPNAAEFVPVYGASEPDIASSPQKGMERSLENISIPTANDFLDEICKRPSDIGENETSMNGDAMSNVSTKAVFGDDSVCLNSTIDSLTNSDALKDTNPFSTTQVPDFVQDHFSIPNLGAQDPFSLPDIEFKPFSQPHQDSEVNFLVGNDKPDLLSSSSQSDPKINVNESSVNDVSGISFGDGFNVEEIMRSKQDSPLLKESPEPSLGLGNENVIDTVTPEDHLVDKISEFSSVKGLTPDLDTVPTIGLTDDVCPNQGPETSVDSEPEQDDVLVSPMKKDQNGIDHFMQKMEETNSIEETEDLICQIKKSKATDLENEYQKEDENFSIKDDVCCIRQTINVEESEVIPERNSLDKLDLIEDIVQKEQTEDQDEVPQPVFTGSTEDMFEQSNPLEMDRIKEFPAADEKHVDAFEINEHLENKTSEPEEVNETKVESFVHHEIPEPYSNILELDKELSKHETVTSEVNGTFSPEREFQNELPVEGLILNSLHAEELISVELSSSLHTEKVEQSVDKVPCQESENASDEGVVTSSLRFEESVIEHFNTKVAVEDDICVTQEVQEDLICPMKLSPLTNEIEDKELLGMESQITVDKEVLKSDSEVNNEFSVNFEDQVDEIISVHEKNEISVSKEDLVCSMRQEIDIMCPIKPKEETILTEKEINLPTNNENIQSYIFGSTGTTYIENNENLEENFLTKGVHETKIEDAIQFNSNFEKNPLDTVCPLRRSSEEEEIIQQESEEAVQNSSQDELFTDEMSSSMIDHGEDKVLPEAQSNQLDLVQELQFEVQEKQAEADTESDSGFEIINASEASTIEMEMRYQSEKEAGAINEKLLMDRNEAETLEKTDLVNNDIDSHISNNTIVERNKAEELIMPEKEETLTESFPKQAAELVDRSIEPEPLTRTIKIEPLERTDMMNGTVTPPATPPATPAPGLKEETKEGLIAAAVAAAGVATAVAAGTAAVAVSESKVEEKKSPVKKTDSPTKAGVAAKAPSKVAPTKAAPAKAPIGKPSTPLSKPSTPTSKPPTKPTSPTAKATATKTSTLASKPSTPTTKVPAKTASKPSTPTGAKPVPSSTTAALKPKPLASTTAKPAASKTAPVAAIKKTAAPSLSAKPAPTAAKPAAAKPAGPATGKPLASKPAAPKPAASAAAKPAPNKVGAPKPAPTSTKVTPTPSRPISAKSTSSTTAPKATSTATKPAAKPAPAKTVAAAKPLTSTIGSKTAPAAPKPLTKAAAPKAAPAAPLNKKPAAPTAIKKPTAPTDKSTKEASNKLTAKTTLNKKIEEKKVISKKEVIGENEEPPAQVAIVTTTNGHINLIENGIPPAEIVAEAN